MIKIFKNIFAFFKRKTEANTYSLTVPTLYDLYNLCQIEDLYVGKQVYVKDEDKIFILTSHRYTNSENIKKCWKEYNNDKEKKLSIFKRKTGINLDGINLCDNNGNIIDFKKEQHLKIFIVEGTNFEKNGIHNGDYLCVDTTKMPKKNDVIMDYESILWQVNDIKQKGNNTSYILYRQDNKNKVINNDGIYGTVTYNWTLNK